MASVVDVVQAVEGKELLCNGRGDKLVPINADVEVNDEDIVEDFQHDKFNLVYIFAFLLGIGMLLPWNVFITANNYWMYKFRDVNDTSKDTNLQIAFASYLSIAFNVPYIITMTMATVFSHKINQVLAISISLFWVLMCFVVVTVLVPVDSDQWQNTFLAVTMITIVVIGIFNGFIQTGLTGLLAILPPRYMYSCMNGQAIAGIFTSVVMILILIGNSSPQESALIYFISAIVALLIASLSFFKMYSSDFFKYHYTNASSSKNGSFSSADCEAQPVTTISTKALVMIQWKYIVSMLLIFWVTISVFPAITVLAESTTFLPTSNLFIPIFCFFVFNCGDFLGRILSTKIPIPMGRPNLIIFISALRIVFIPLFMLGNTKGHHLYFPIWFHSDIYYVIFMLLFSVSNGYLVTIIMMQGPKNVKPDLQQKAGSLLITCLGLGITLGSVSSLLFVKLL